MSCLSGYALARCGAVSLLVVGCQASEYTEPRGGSQDGSTVQPTNETQLSDRASHAQTLLIQEVQWPGAEVNQASVALLPRRARQAVSKSHVPVWVPHATLGLSPLAHVVAKEHWTVFSASGQGITVTISANKASRRHPGI